MIHVGLHGEWGMLELVKTKSPEYYHCSNKVAYMYMIEPKLIIRHKVQNLLSDNQVIRNIY